jgi:hypothetical protein
VAARLFLKLGSLYQDVDDTMNVADRVLKDRHGYEAYAEDCRCLNRWSRAATTRSRKPPRVNDPDHTVKTRPGWPRASSRPAASCQGRTV